MQIRSGPTVMHASLQAWRSDTLRRSTALGAPPDPAFRSGKMWESLAQLFSALVPHSNCGVGTGTILSTMHDLVGATL